MTVKRANCIDTMPFFVKYDPDEFGPSTSTIEESCPSCYNYTRRFMNMCVNSYRPDSVLLDSLTYSFPEYNVSVLIKVALGDIKNGRICEGKYICFHDDSPLHHTISKFPP